MNKNEELLPYYKEASRKLYYNPLTGEFRRFRDGKLAGGVKPNGYTRIGVTVDGKRKDLRAHRLAWYFAKGELPTKDIDHIDGDRSNNKISNLRECSRLENNRNCKISTRNTTGYKGVSIDKRCGKFRANISNKGRNMLIGSYDTAEEAYDAYINKAKELFGDFFNAR